MKILVTGAAGFIGSHLAERLAHLGHEVIGIDAATPYYDPAVKVRNGAAIVRAGARLLWCDLAVDALQELVQDVQVIYHLAGQPGISHTTLWNAYLRNNVVATQRLLEVVGSALQMFVNVSTSSVYGANANGDEQSVPRPTSLYGVSKLAAEQLVLAQQRDSGLPACSLRLFSVYGPRERPEKLFPSLMRAMLLGQEFPLYDGSYDHVRSYTYVGDVVKGLTAVLERLDACNGEIFNIGTEETCTTGQAIAIVKHLMGQSPRIVIRPRRPGDQVLTRANIDKARRVLGYQPQTPLEVGLEQELHWARGAYGKD